MPLQVVTERENQPLGTLAQEERQRVKRRVCEETLTLFYATKRACMTGPLVNEKVKKSEAARRRVGLDPKYLADQPVAQIYIGVHITRLLPAFVSLKPTPPPGSFIGLAVCVWDVVFSSLLAGMGSLRSISVMTERACRCCLVVCLVSENMESMSCCANSSPTVSQSLNW